MLCAYRRHRGTYPSSPSVLWIAFAADRPCFSVAADREISEGGPVERMEEDGLETDFDEAVGLRLGSGADPGFHGRAALVGGGRRTRTGSALSARSFIPE